MLIQPLTQAIGKKHDLALYIARADLVSAIASGNKIYKLKPYIKYAKKRGIKRIVSFGGAFSNHIHALALYGREQGLATIGIIRGDPGNSALYRNNPTLKAAEHAGMQLHFISRREYARRNEHTYLIKYERTYPDALIIPEGGSGRLALAGCAQMAREINQAVSCDLLAVPCGTGTTLAGILTELRTGQRAIGYSVVKDSSLTQRIERLLLDSRLSIEQLDGAFHQNDKNSHDSRIQLLKADFGGYAKLDQALLDFILDWHEKTGILLDPVYTGKMAMRIMQQIEAGTFKPGTSICLVHTGGLQGWQGMRQRVIQLSGEKAWKRIKSQLFLNSYNVVTE